MSKTCKNNQYMDLTFCLFILFFSDQEKIEILGKIKALNFFSKRLYKKKTQDFIYHHWQKI